MKSTQKKNHGMKNGDIEKKKISLRKRKAIMNEDTKKKKLIEQKEKMKQHQNEIKMNNN